MNICQDVLTYIYEFLELKDFLKVRLVSKKFHTIFNGEYIWKVKYFEYINEPIPKKYKSEIPEFWISKIKKNILKKYRLVELNVDMSPLFRNNFQNLNLITLKVDSSSLLALCRIFEIDYPRE